MWVFLYVSMCFSTYSQFDAVMLIVIVIATNPTADD